jgi:RimJ/RimL family protein N-acetyltransferase
MTSQLTSISFRPFREEDFPQLLTWFRAPHVARWWPVPDSADAVAAKYLPRIRGEEDIRLSAILVDGAPIGMIQTSPADQQHAAGLGACNIDLLIGEEASIGAGLGPLAIEAFVTAEVFGRLGFSVCLADPHEDNQRSVRAFEKAGFTRRSRFLQDNQAFLLLSRHRSEPSP